MPATREIRIQIDVLDMDGNVLSSIDQRIIDGQVTVATDAEGPTRSLSLSLYDPNHRLRLDSDAPQAGSLYADRMLRVRYGVKVPEVGWVDVPVFTGPIIKADRDGAAVKVECQGKESIALRTVWRTFTVPKGTQKTDAIRRILRERAGETFFDIPDLPTRLGSHATLTPEPPDKRAKFNAATPWSLAREIAQSMDRQLFYDGWGRCRLRRLPGSPVFTFDHSLIQSEPNPGFDMTRTRNAVRVIGKSLHDGKEKKGTPQIPTHVVSGEAVAKANHPLSPERLGRTQSDGSKEGGFIPEIVRNDAVRSDRAATQLAHRILDDMLIQYVNVDFSALPVPHAEELDMVRVKYDDLNFRMRLRRFVLPLVAMPGQEHVMTIGDSKRITKPRRR